MRTYFLFIALLLSSVFHIQSQILYQIDKEGNKPSFIFGSHHLSPISIVEESGVMEYFNQTDQVVGEIDLTIDPMTISMKLQPYMTAPSDSTLSVLLKGENMDSLNAQFIKWAPMPGMQLQMLEPLKPMAVSTLLASGMSMEAMPGFDPSQQLDSFFFQVGVKENKKIIGLETIEYQGEVLFNMTPLTAQAETLIEMLKNPEESVKTARKLSSAYQNRDLQALREIMEETEENPEFMDRILYKRNQDWMEKLPSIIDENSSFIVVGAMHLIGPAGILQGLQNAGYTITPLY